ncbi:cysteine hydrolase family protein [Microvirga pakistanensis]|uniref:cysteine hydrolase family protein n=1 Tax=Microvirga pakistanensis TaxID=1682650 RepID=UPI00106C2282|nr:isochorismatase family cysteine hydrolase [Microvirga pakistanensis]
MFVLDRPALIIVDMQNDFVRNGAPFEVPNAIATVPRIQALATLFRNLSLPVIYTRYIADDLYLPLQGRLSWIAKLKPPVQACVPGVFRQYGDAAGERETTAIIDELAPRPDDLIVDKIYFSAFHLTDLGQRLRAMSVSSLVITGTVTEMCVEDTARHAVHFGFPTAVVSDAVSSNDDMGHAAALSAFDRNFGWVLTTEQVAGMVAGAPGLGAGSLAASS